ncbi:ATP-binding protein [Salinicola rhizosphaerae]|uniref:histidine kinase n=1 Tax=Salinicola rhizosphaerae TaxID=1443141 RepID=A0ABQ3E1X7_9GAMM|nr:ATP-binding protein [Salinicola rhizosphaerae]GHB20768.1 two-component system sensor histidine kinase DcuS [Salinicola rhizosphaerae]
MKRLRLSAQLFVLVASMIVLTLGVALLLFNYQLRANLEQAQGERVMGLAASLADRADVRAALTAKPIVHDPDSLLRARIEALRERLGVDFITVIDTRHLRLTHPDPYEIGRHFRGDDEGPALAGESYVSRAEGTLGVSIRGFSPVLGSDGQVIGAVATGVTLKRVGLLLSERSQVLWLGIVGLMLIGGLGAWCLAHYIKRVLLGFEPHQISGWVRERQAMLASLHEGVLAINAEGEVTLVNPAARQLLNPLGGTEAALPREVLDELFDSGAVSLNRRLTLNGRALIVNRVPIRAERGGGGSIVTLRDRSEVNRLAEELTGVSRYAQALRASTHEFKNRLHVILGLVQLRDIGRLERYLRELDDTLIAPAAARVAGVKDPILAGFLLAKGSEARERQVALEIELDSDIPAPDSGETGHWLVTIIGNLLENAFEAVAERNLPSVTLSMGLDAGELSLHVADNGAGMGEIEQHRALEQGISSKGEGRGYGLAMVKAHVESLEGTLALYSTPGRGTLVEVTLPYAADATTLTDGVI